MKKRKYSHVIVVGIDGAGAFIKDADTPYFDRIFKEGAITYSALASCPTISAECWGSMLLGVGPEVHGLTNDLVSKNPYPLDAQFPSVFRRIRNVYPEAELGSFCQWYPITNGIVENDVGISQASAPDTEMTPVICRYIKEKKPEFLFVQMDSVDGAGHRNGYGSQGHMDRIHEVDCLVNDVYQAVKDAGMLADTLFMVIADHGGYERSHGGWTDEEKYVTFAAAGKGVMKGEIPEMNIRDLAAIILYAFGIELPVFSENGWTAQIPNGIWEETGKLEYLDISHLTGVAPRVSKIPHTSELI